MRQDKNKSELHMILGQLKLRINALKAELYSGIREEDKCQFNEILKLVDELESQQKQEIKQMLENKKNI